MSLANIHRPKKLDEVLGNATTIKALKGMLGRSDGKIPRAFLFHGPFGCGKTTLARIVGAELGIAPQELIEVNAADFKGIDTVRDIRDQAMYKAMYGESKGWILDEAHKLTNDAQNALLKLTEDPPPGVFFFIATTDPGKLIKTLSSRFVKFGVELLSDSDARTMIRRTAKAEGLKLTEDVEDAIVSASLGSGRNIMFCLDSILDLTSEDEMLDLLSTLSMESTETIDLCRALMAKGTKWKDVAKILKALDKDAESVRHAVMGYFNSVLLSGTDNPRAVLVLSIFAENSFMYSGKPGLTVACYNALTS